MSLQTFIDEFPFPVLVVNGAYEPVAVNKTGARSSRLTIEIVPNPTMGAIVECEHSKLPEGCGRTIHCSGCTLRRTLEETNETGRPFFMIPATVTSGSKEISVYVSTVKANDRIVVKLDKATAKPA